MENSKQTINPMKNEDRAIEIKEIILANWEYDNVEVEKVVEQVIQLYSIQSDQLKKAEDEIEELKETILLRDKHIDEIKKEDRLKISLLQSGNDIYKSINEDLQKNK